MISVSEKQLNRILVDMEHLITDVADLLSQDAVAARRLQELRAKPSMARSEAELDAYLKQRGVDRDLGNS